MSQTRQDMRAFKIIVVMRAENVGRDNRSEMTAKLFVVGAKLKERLHMSKLL